MKALCPDTVTAGGLGNPYFTTDSAAALRASEIKADILIKATKVNGVYDSDPRKNPDAVKFDQVSYAEVLSRGLQVADAAAFSLCMENSLPIVVFALQEDGNIGRAVRGEKIGTLVSGTTGAAQ